MWRLLILLLVLSSFIQAQNVGINATGNAPNSSAMLDIESADKGLLIPRVSLTDIADVVTIPTPALSLLVYNTNAAITGGSGLGYYYFDGTNWIKLIDGSTANTNWSIIGNAATVDGTNFIGTTDDVPFTIRVNNVQAGRITNTPTNQTALGYEAGVENRGTNNTAIGYKALHFNGGSRNTALGSLALYYNRNPGLSASYPSDNTALGYAALYNNTSGIYNTAIGSNALYSNTTGDNNTANGWKALYSNTTGDNNTAFGLQALANNTSGTTNTAIGLNSLLSNNIGNANTAIGFQALLSNSTGINNVATGYEALKYNTTGLYNTATGSEALYSNTTGLYNTATGYAALYNNTTGIYNTAIGSEALYNNITANNNTAVGHEALYSNTTGYDNTATGLGALRYNTTGNYNTASGWKALYINSTGNYNTAIGMNSLLSNNTGNANTAIGFQALMSNFAGLNNVATGYEALKYNNSGSANNAYGHRALYQCGGTGNGGYGEEANPTTLSGWNNIGIGYHTLGAIDASGLRILGNQIGYDNIALGLVAGDRIGSNCNQSAFIGPFTNVITNNTDVSNSTALGNGALVFQNNMMRLGNSAVTRIETQVGLTVVSDGRYKFNVTEEVKGLAFIKKLRPVIYQYNTQLMDKEWMKSEFDTMVKHNPQLLKDYEIASNIRYSGFIAQEVEQAAKESNYDFNGVSKPENTDGHYGLNYSEFVVPIVKSVQEIQVIIDEQKQRIDKLESLVKELLKK